MENQEETTMDKDIGHPIFINKSKDIEAENTSSSGGDFIFNSEMDKEHNTKKLEEDIQKWKSSTKSLEEEISKTVGENNNYKMILNEKDRLIEKMIIELQKRDKLFDLSCNYNNKYSSTKNQDLPESLENDKQKVFIDVSPDGRRIIEYHNKKQVPYWIKTETLDPVMVDVVADAFLSPSSSISTEHLAQNLITESGIKTEEEGEFPEFYRMPKVKKEIIKTTLKEETPSSSKLKPKSSSSSKSRNRKRSRSPKSKSNESRDKKPKVEIKEEDKEDSKLYATGSFSSLDRKRKVTSNSNDNVLNIPEALRFNFGTGDWEIADCPIGLKFWFDVENSHCTKFYFKLHDDFGDWQNKTMFTLIEQIGLSHPKKYRLRFDDLLKKLENTRNKRIWLDIRDFNVFSPCVQSLLGKKIPFSITHFSFGPQLYSEDVLKTNLFLEFMYRNLVNMEYLCVNNGMLCSLNAGSREPRWIRKFPKLKTIRFIHSKLNFFAPFIFSILEMSPYLSKIYGFPLHLLNKREPAAMKLLEMGGIKSIYIRRDNYNMNDAKATDFLRDLTTLYRQKKMDTLEQLDTRTFFLFNCKSSTRNLIVERMSKLIQCNKNSLLIIKLKLSKDSPLLKIPKLKNLTTLQLDINEEQDRRSNSNWTIFNEIKKEEGELEGGKMEDSDNVLSCGFFPKDFDIKGNFPKLSSVQIFMDFHNSSFRRDFPLGVFEKYFPSEIFKSGVFNNVKDLLLHGFAVEECMPKVIELFPNIKKLRLHHDVSEIKRIIPYCYKNWNGLKQLILEVANGPCLDSILLGVHGEKFAKLKNMKWKSQEEEIQKLISNRGDNYSICRLTELEILRIVLRPAAFFDRNNGPILTEQGATAIYALGQEAESEKSQLQAQIAFDERVAIKEKKGIIASLRPVLQYACIKIDR